MSEEYNNGCLDWDDTITDSGKYTKQTILDEGDYNFTVASMTRGRFSGGAKIPPCNKANLTLDVDTGNGKVTVQTDLLLYTSVEWRLASFFRCVNLMRPGEQMTMDWSKVVGTRGRAHFKARAYTDKNGNERQVNAVDYYIDYDKDFFKVDDKFAEIIEDDDELPF